MAGAGRREELRARQRACGRLRPPQGAGARGAQCPPTLQRAGRWGRGERAPLGLLLPWPLPVSRLGLRVASERERNGHGARFGRPDRRPGAPRWALSPHSRPGPRARLRGVLQEVTGEGVISEHTRARAGDGAHSRFRVSAGCSGAAWGVCRGLGQARAEPSAGPPLPPLILRFQEQNVSLLSALPCALATA